MGNNPEKVYVVSWEYDGGGGFDWFYDKAIAKHALEQEKKEPSWDAVYFWEHETSLLPDADAVTKEIDRDLFEFQRTAEKLTLTHAGGLA
jgi:hypothetical protein